MSLLNRVNRILNRPHQSRQQHRWQLGLLALLLPMLLVWAGPETNSLAEEEFKDFPVENKDAPFQIVVKDDEGVITVDTPQGAVVAKEGNLVFGPGAKDNPGVWHFETLKNPPTEANKVTLPDYVIEPPDMLSIEGIRLIPKAPAKLKAQDIVQIVVAGTPKDAPIALSLIHI